MNDILLRIENEGLVYTERPATKSIHLSAEGTDLFYALAPDGRVQPYLVDRLGRASRYKVAQCSCSACAAATIFETKTPLPSLAQRKRRFDRVLCRLGLLFISGCSIYATYVIVNAILWSVAQVVSR